MIPICRMEFQPVQPGQISTYDYMGKSIFILARRDSFPLGIGLDFFTFFFIFLSKHVLHYIFTPLSWAEAITWENFVPARQDRGSTK